VTLIAIRGSLAVLLGLSLYRELYRRTTVLHMPGFRVMFSRGILFKIRGSIPLVPVVQVYARQTPLDMLFDLHRVEIFTPLTPKAEYTVVTGLTAKSAFGFQKFLTNELNRQVFVVGEANQSEDNAYDSPEETHAA